MSPTSAGPPEPEPFFVSRTTRLLGEGSDFLGGIIYFILKYSLDLQKDPLKTILPDVAPHEGQPIRDLMIRAQTRRELGRDRTLCRSRLRSYQETRPTQLSLNGVSCRESLPGPSSRAPLAAPSQKPTAHKEKKKHLKYLKLNGFCETHFNFRYLRVDQKTRPRRVSPVLMSWPKFHRMAEVPAGEAPRRSKSF